MYLRERIFFQRFVFEWVGSVILRCPLSSRIQKTLLWGINTCTNMLVFSKHFCMEPCGVNVLTARCSAHWGGVKGSQHRLSINLFFSAFIMFDLFPFGASLEFCREYLLFFDHLPLCTYFTLQFLFRVNSVRLSSPSILLPVSF